jgi:hypothetical protein
MDSNNIPQSPVVNKKQVVVLGAGEIIIHLLVSYNSFDPELQA